MKDPQIHASALENSVLIVAHPDDEILWFGSIAPAVDKIVICFRDDPGNAGLAESRERTIAAHPWSDRIEFLRLTETGSFGHANWARPEITEFGLKIKGSRQVARNYRNCATSIREALRPIIEGAANVFTHNPWGEYGHEEHVLVHRVATSLAYEQRKAVWYNNYMSNWSEQLSRAYLFDPRDGMSKAKVDVESMGKIADLYRRHGAWTWFDDYTWFEEEIMVGGILPIEPAPRVGQTMPVNFISLPDRPADRNRPKIFRLARRFVRRIFSRGSGND